MNFDTEIKECFRLFERVSAEKCAAYLGITRESFYQYARREFGIGELKELNENHLYQMFTYYIAKKYNVYRPRTKEGFDNIVKNCARDLLVYYSKKVLDYLIHGPSVDDKGNEVPLKIPQAVLDHVLKELREQNEDLVVKSDHLNKLMRQGDSNDDNPGSD